MSYQVSCTIKVLSSREQTFKLGIYSYGRILRGEPMASRNDIFSLAGNIGISDRGSFENCDRTKLQANQLHYLFVRGFSGVQNVFQEMHH